MEYKENPSIQFDPVIEEEESDPANFGLVVWPCDWLIDMSSIKTSNLEYLEPYQNIANVCPEDYSLLKDLADIYYTEKENASADWLKLAIITYEQTIVQIKTGFGDAEKKFQFSLFDSYWKLANLYESVGMYEQAIANYNLLKKYTPKKDIPIKRPVGSRIEKLKFDDENINYPEEAIAHSIVCRFLMKNRPATAAAVVIKDTVVTTAMVERMDFSEQAIEQRAGLAPIKQMVEEVEKKQQYKTKDPQMKGKVIDVALLALSWAIAPKGMKVEQRNQFIMGTLSAIITLVDKDNVSATGTNTMKTDLAGLKGSPVAQKAETTFNKMDAPAKAASVDESKKIETAGGVTISDKWEVADISGQYELMNWTINCLNPTKSTTCNQDGTQYIVKGNPYKYTKVGENQYSYSHEWSIIIPHSEGGHSSFSEEIRDDFKSTGTCSLSKNILDCQVTTEYNRNGYKYGIGTNTVYSQPIKSITTGRGKSEILSNGQIKSICESSNCDWIAICKKIK